MKRLIGLVVLLLAAPAFAGDEVIPFTRFPTGKDRSIRMKNDDHCHWWDGRTATQAERAMMYLEGVAVLQPQGLKYAKYTPSCASEAHSNESNFETDNLRLRYFYVDFRRDKEWSIKNGGCPDYGHTIGLGKDLQRCSTKNDKAAKECAASPYMTQDILDWTDMKIVDGKCVKGADYEVVIPEDEDKEMAMRGHLDYRIPLPPLTAEQRYLAHHVMELHHAGSDEKCGEHSGPMMQSVKEAMTALLQSAVSERQKHSFLMIFPTDVDLGPTGWNDQEMCDLAQLEHFAWQAWDSCFDLPGDQMWGCLTRARVSHETTHIMASYRSEDDEVEYRISDHVNYPMDFPHQTADEWLECFRNDPDRCGILWLPADWQIVLP